VARPRTPAPPVLLRSARLLDVVAGDYLTPGDVMVEGGRIVAVQPR